MIFTITLRSPAVFFSHAATLEAICHSARRKSTISNFLFMTINQQPTSRQHSCCFSTKRSGSAEQLPRVQSLSQQSSSGDDITVDAVQSVSHGFQKTMLLRLPPWRLLSKSANGLHKVVSLRLCRLLINAIRSQPIVQRTRIILASFATIRPLRRYVHCGGASIATVRPLRRYVHCDGMSIATVRPLRRYVHCDGMSTATVCPLRRYNELLGQPVLQQRP